MRLIDADRLKNDLKHTNIDMIGNGDLFRSIIKIINSQPIINKKDIKEV